MRYFRWDIFENKEPNPPLYHVDLDAALEFNGCNSMGYDFKYDSAKKVKGWKSIKVIRLEKSGRGKPPIQDNQTNLITVKLISERAKKFFRAEKIAQAQYLPVEILFPKEAKARKYYILNLLNIVDCIDLNRTPHKITSDKDGVKELDLPFWRNEIIFDREKIGEHKLFRLRYLESDFVVREDLKNSIEKAGLTGFGFSEYGAQE